MYFVDRRFEEEIKKANFPKDPKKVDEIGEDILKEKQQYEANLSKLKHEGIDAQTEEQKFEYKEKRITRHHDSLYETDRDTLKADADQVTKNELELAAEVVQEVTTKYKETYCKSPNESSQNTAT
jgi:hypothetical protein